MGNGHPPALGCCPQSANPMGASGLGLLPALLVGGSRGAVSLLASLGGGWVSAPQAWGTPWGAGGHYSPTPPSPNGVPSLRSFPSHESCWWGGAGALGDTRVQAAGRGQAQGPCFNSSPPAPASTVANLPLKLTQASTHPSITFPAVPSLRSIGRAGWEGGGVGVVPPLLHPLAPGRRG